MALVTALATMQWGYRPLAGDEAMKRSSAIE
jgi:hypothetical protein